MLFKVFLQFPYPNKIHDNQNVLNFSSRKIYFFVMEFLNKNCSGALQVNHLENTKKVHLDFGLPVVFYDYLGRLQSG